MRFQHSLSAKVIILVTLPLLLQLSFFAWLNILQNNAELELAAANKARQVSDAINILSKDIYEGEMFCLTRQDVKEISENQRFNEMIERIRRDYKVLEASSPENSRGIILKSKSAADSCLATMLEISDSVRKNGNGPLQENLWRQLHEEMQHLNYQDLVAIGREQKSIANRAPEIQANFRKETKLVLMAGSLTTLVMTILVAIYLTRSITSKLERLSDNTVRLASARPLNPVLRGNDDIAVLDRTFHQMANELQESARRERAIVEHARDFICSITGAGKIAEANPAVTALLGYSQQDVDGRYFIDLVGPDDKERTLEFIDNLKKEAKSNKLQLQLRRSDGTLTDVLLSANWSPEEKKFSCIIHDISDRMQSERLRQELMAMATHDLRTPLSTIRNLVFMLKEALTGQVEERFVNYLNIADRNADRMMRLITDLIDSESLKADGARKWQLDLQPISLNSSFGFCEESIKPLAQDVGVTIIFVATNLVVKADERMLERILFNLAANAVKFSEKGATVRVSAKKVSAFAQVTVEDTGQGIREEDLGSIFERYSKGTARAAKQFASSGLGLSICKSFVELHQGKIWVESSVGKGSRFHFTMPLDQSSNS
jgi:PAS domain S-box-containing protein